MKVTTVGVEQCFNTGNYENLRVRLEAQLEDGDTIEAVVEKLQEQIHMQADRADDWKRVMEQRNELRQLETQITQAREQWEQTRTFMAAQGLKTDAPDFPIPGQKALAAASTTVEVTNFE